MTSEATPLFAGIVALAARVAGHPLGLINPALYTMSARHLPGIVDVTSGNNTVSFTQDGQLYTVQGYSAREGYSLAAGVGHGERGAVRPGTGSPRRMMRLWLGPVLDWMGPSRGLLRRPRVMQTKSQSPRSLRTPVTGVYGHRKPDVP
jgi:hypothetical protein